MILFCTGRNSAETRTRKSLNFDKQLEHCKAQIGYFRRKNFCGQKFSRIWAKSAKVLCREKFCIPQSAKVYSRMKIKKNL